MVATVKAIVVVLMGEFCGGLWSRPLSQDLFSPRVPSAGKPGSSGGAVIIAYHSSEEQVKNLKIIEAKVMISEEGFT